MATRRRNGRALAKPAGLLVLAIVALASIALLYWTATPGHAATFTVTKTADTNDGVCDPDCSLREAIGAAPTPYPVPTPSSCRPASIP